jgi:2-polyprenyl-6-hydroxyphenyl methylase/3-demethylubiquinone-9 3-methyltransferase
MVNNRNNFDETELARFESMASIWWDKNGDLKALHDINTLRLNYINERSPIAGKRVLDVGCGGGILSESMAAMGADVTGIDIGKEALAVAEMHLKTSGLHVNYELNTAESLPVCTTIHFYANTHSAVICM